MCGYFFVLLSHSMFVIASSYRNFTAIIREWDYSFWNHNFKMHFAGVIISNARVCACACVWVSLISLCSFKGLFFCYTLQFFSLLLFFPVLFAWCDDDTRRKESNYFSKVGCTWVISCLLFSWFAVVCCGIAQRSAVESRGDVEEKKLILTVCSNNWLASSWIKRASERTRCDTEKWVLWLRNSKPKRLELRAFDTHYCRYNRPFVSIRIV